MTDKLVKIPNPNCYTCDGVGWYEGGKAIKTNCDCLRTTTNSKAQQFVVNGTHAQWEGLYRILDRCY